MNPSNAPVAMFAKRSLQLSLVFGAAISFIEVTSHFNSRSEVEEKRVCGYARSCA